METIKKGITLVNAGISGVSLIDVNDRVYTIGLGGRLRVSADSLRDIVDYLPSRILLLDGHVKIENSTLDMYEDCGLTDDEIMTLVGEKPVESKIELSKEETAVSADVIAVTYHNWLKNSKYDKIIASLDNPKNVELLTSIVAQHEKYNTIDVQRILAEVK